MYERWNFPTSTTRQPRFHPTVF
jgi:hypothetical protein